MQGVWRFRRQSCSVEILRPSATEPNGYPSNLNAFQRFLNGLCSYIDPRRPAIQSLESFLLKRKVKHGASLTLGWLSKHEQHFRVAPKSEDELLAQVKHLIELMMLLNTLTNHGLRGEPISTLTERAIKYGEEFDWHQLAAFDASAATVIAMVADFFVARNLTPPLDLDYIRSLHNIGFFEGMDRIPFREMDLSYCLSLIISPEFFKQLPAEFMNTTFGLRQHLAR